MRFARYPGTSLWSTTGIFPTDEPKHAHDYYGPNTAFKELLAQYPDDAGLVREIAARRGFAIEVHRGAVGPVHRSLPVIVAVDDRADFTLTGGHGFLPITITGLEGPDGIRLGVERDGTAEWVEVPGEGDILRQTDFDPEDGTYGVSYTFDLAPAERWRFRLERSP